MPKEKSNDLVSNVENSIKMHNESGRKRLDDELRGIQKRFARQIRELPKALEAAGGPKAKELQAMGQQVFGGTSTSAYKKIYKDFADAHGPAIEKAFKSLGLNAESCRKDLLQIAGIKAQHWAQGRYLVGSTGLLLAEEKGGD